MDDVSDKKNEHPSNQSNQMEAVYKPPERISLKPIVQNQILKYLEWSNKIPVSKFWRS